MAVPDTTEQIRLLYFEDDPGLQISIPKLIRREGWEPLVTADPEQFKQLALAAIQENTPTVYLIDNTNVRTVGEKKITGKYMLQLVHFLASYNVPLGRIVGFSGEPELRAQLDPNVRFFLKGGNLSELIATLRAASQS